MADDKLYTEEQLAEHAKQYADGRIKGIVDQQRAAEAKAAELQKFVDERKAADEAAEQRKLEEQGKFDEIKATMAQQVEDYKAQLADRDQKVQEFADRETQRLEAVAALNKERADKLPDDLKVLIPDALQGDALSAQIDKLERLFIKAGGVQVNSGSGGGPPAMTWEALREKQVKQGLDFLKPAPKETK